MFPFLSTLFECVHETWILYQLSESHLPTLISLWWMNYDRILMQLPFTISITIATDISKFMFGMTYLQ